MNFNYMFNSNDYIHSKENKNTYNCYRIKK